MHNFALSIVLASLLLGSLPGCGPTQQAVESPAATQSGTSGVEEASGQEQSQTADPEQVSGGESAPAAGSEAGQEDEEMLELEISAGGRVFTAQLYDSETVRALMDRMPLDLEMSELNGNEKYYYFEESLPALPQQISQIQAGDLMLYGSDCLVLFYETFSTSYRYTPIGHIEDASGLAEALGGGSVSVSFRAR